MNATVSHTVTSADGTTLACDRVGSGPALVLVDGALCHRKAGPNGALAEQLAGSFTVYTYDRRGRGESGDTGPFSLDKEIDDLRAVIEEAGGSAMVYGISSGAALALEAAERGLPITALALFEAPFVVDDSRAPVPAEYVARLSELVAAGNRSGAVKYFMRTGVGLPAPMVALMPLMPAWKGLKAVAHTLPYDTAFVVDRQRGEPLPTWHGVKVPTLVVDGGKSPQWMRNAMRALAQAVPGAGYRTLPGQTHIVKAEALAPVLAEFFTTA
ncbi:alpha/beta fold hydrolase [Nonomuraea sp. NBC_01738]|uniref:alpha/beta fold hydrolase n=1 Tax=Nonomuraea sp. NBC_01738 TaxID=2976003 RepID=UPI002E0DB66E|nr:alpha/beta fold hydrolase [Nonomuraea sp. NBC_01738]